MKRLDFDPYLFPDDDTSDGPSHGGAVDVMAVDSTHLVVKLAENALAGDTYDRKEAAGNLLDAFRQTCFNEEDVRSVIAVIDELVNDQDHTVRLIVMDQLPQIALFCDDEGPYLDYVLPQHILPHIVRLLSDKFSQQVRNSAQNGLLLLVKRGIIGPSEVEEFVCPVLNELTDPLTDMTKLMCGLAPLLGKDATVKLFLKRFCQLCQEMEDCQVRKVCASCIGEMGKVIGTSLTEAILLEHFKLLCKDGIWGVRKGCAEAFTLFSSVCRLSTRKGILSEMFIALLRDSSKWVRVAANESLGPFITTFLVRESEESPPATPELTDLEKRFIESYEESKCERSSEKSEVKKTACAPDPLWDLYFGEQPLNIDHGKLVNIAKKIIAKRKGTGDWSSHDGLDKFQSDHDAINTEESDELGSQISKHLNDSESAPRELDFDAQSLSDPSSDINSVIKNVQLQDDSSSSSTVSTDGKESSSESTDKTLVGISKKCLSTFYDQFNHTVTTSRPNADGDASVDCRTNDKSVCSAKGLTDIKEMESHSLFQSNETGSVDSFNVWQFWREPLAIVDLDIDGNEIPLPYPTQQCNIQPVPSENNGLQRQFSVDAAEETDGNVGSNLSSNVYRSYENLCNPTTKDSSFWCGSSRANQEADDDTSEDLYSSIIVDSEDGQEDVWSKSRPRMLEDVPKSNITQDIVPQPLLDHFVSMSNCDNVETSDSQELLSYCVYNLPAVVHTLGPQNWSLLRDCYEMLACSMQWKVRFTLAASLHEIANILGPELSERDLLPFYYSLLKDLDEVRMGLLKNLASFIKILGSEARKKCLESLDKFVCTENVRNWRFRLELAEQIHKLSEIYEVDLVFKYLCPLVMNLYNDPVADVRKQALNVTPYIVHKLNYGLSNEKSAGYIVHEFLLSLVRSLGHSSNWSRRQAFATLSGLLLEYGAVSASQFAKEILPHLVTLSEDNVPNVRLIVAQTLSTDVIRQEYFSDPSNPHREIILCTLQKLQEDEDRDVRFYCQLDNSVDQFI